MREPLKLLACALFAASAFVGVAHADGLNNKTPWAVREPSGPVDKGLGGDVKEKPAAESTAAKTGSTNQNVVSGIAPPVAPQAVEEPAPIAPVTTKELNPDGTVKTQALAGDQTPIWQNRWLWALLALLLIAAAVAVEYFGRKRDEALAAEEPEDAPLKA